MSKWHPIQGILLIATAMVLCLFALPSTALAASWGPIASHHPLDSPNFGYTGTLPFGGNSVAQCTSASFTSFVANASTMEITASTFGANCTTVTASGGVCAMTFLGTNFPWTATAATTSNIQIHGILIQVQLHQSSFGTCPIAEFVYRLTGTLTGGAWTGNGAGQHEIILDNETGLISDSAVGNTPVTTRGTLRDTPQTLTVS